MRSTAKTILVMLFLFAIFSSIKAQDKYEFMIINYILAKGALSPHLITSIDGNEMNKEFIKIEKSDDYYNLDTKPLLNKIKEYQTQKWEVMSFNMTPYYGSVGFIHTAYLKRKKE